MQMVLVAATVVTPAAEPLTMLTTVFSHRVTSCLLVYAFGAVKAMHIIIFDVPLPS